MCDGINLVAQEGPLVNQRAGVVVLSAGAGCADTVPGWMARQLKDLRAVTDGATPAAVRPAPLSDPLGQQIAGVASFWS